MAILVVEHEKDCPPGLLQRDGVALHVVRPYAGDELPTSPEGWAALVVLGGEMNANEDSTYPWLAPTRRLIAHAHAAGLPTFLVCLGHQLGAVALGGVVERSPLGPLWGVFPVGLTEEGRRDPVLGRLGETPTTVHWNGDLVTAVPDGGVVLARDPRGGVQAVRYGSTTWGVQCHPEVDVEIVSRWAASQRDTVNPGSEARARAALAEVCAHESDIHRAWRPALDAFLDLAARAS